MTLLLLTGLAAGDMKLPPPRPWKAPEVKLLTAGDAPRTPLRYALKPQTHGHAELTGTGEWRVGPRNATVGGPLPALSTPFDVSVDSAGQWSFTFAPASASGDQDLGGAAAVVRSLDGVTGTVKLDDRGLASAVTVQPSPNDALHKQDAEKIEVGSYYAMEVARTTFMHLITPLPAEPIGLGATWQVERPATRGSITYTEVATFTLIARDAQGAKLTVRLGGKPDPYGPVRADQLELNVGGEADCALQLASPLPARLDEHLTLHAVVGARDAQRIEHEGAVASHLRFDRK